MAILQQLSVLAMRQAFEGMIAGERTAESVAAFLNQYFTDHSQSLTKAMQRATDRSWKALEIALAGETLWNKFDSADHKAFREQVRTFLDSTPLDGLPNHTPQFRRDCLNELRRARKEGVLGGSLEPKTLAEKVGEFARFSDPDSLLQAEWEAVEQLAAECEKADFPTLAYLVQLKSPGEDTALLIVAVRFFFRREIESDRQLYQGLSWAKFELIQTTQDHAFASLSEVLVANHEEVEAMLQTVHSAIIDTHQNVIDLQQDVKELAGRFDLLHRELQPRDSFSISNDAERRLVKELVKRYRALPEDERRAIPELLNAIGKLEVAAGDFRNAQHDFEQAAAIAKDTHAEAEAYFNSYSAALEQGKLDAALAALKKAAELHGEKYEPFPLKKYTPERILGAGGFGVAFLCRNRHTGKQMVVKTLRSETLDRTMTDVFREAQVLEELDHSAIIRLRDCDYADADETRPFIVMDYFNGVPLDEYIEQHGTLTADDAISLMRPVAEALRVAHERNILHRDVKPGNLLVRKKDGKWQVKLIDFGLALKQQAIQHSMAVSTAHGTNTLTGYSIAGTMDYAAPEQLGKLPGVAAGPYTDVYGLAKTMCFALFKTVQPLRKHWREIPDGLADLLEQCLSEEPKERLADFTAVLTELEKPTKKPPKEESVTPPLPPSHQEKPKPPVSEPTQLIFQPVTPGRKGDWWREAPKGIEPSATVVHRLSGHDDAVRALAFSHDGDWLLSGSGDRTIRVWYVPTGEETQRLVGHQDKVCNVEFVAGRDSAISSSEDKSVRLWNLVDGEQLRRFPAKTNRSVAVSPDWRYAICGGVSDGNIRFWEMGTGRELARWKGHNSWVLSLQFSPDGRQALSSSADGTVRLWDVHSGRELRKMEGHTDQVWKAVFDKTGERALSCSADKTIRHWDLRTGNELNRYGHIHDQAWSIAVTTNGPYAVCDCDDGNIGLWEFDTGDRFYSLPVHSKKALTIAVSPNGEYIASGGTDNKVYVWRLNV